MSKKYKAGSFFRRRNSRNWYYAIMIDGKYKRYSCHTTNFEEAKRVADEKNLIKTCMENDIPRHTVGEPNPISLTRFISEHYWPWANDHKKASTLEYEQVVLDQLEAFLGREIRLSELNSAQTLDTFQRWLRSGRKKKNKKSTIQRKMNVIASVLRLGVRYEYLKAQKKISWYSRGEVERPMHERRILTEEEEVRLLTMSNRPTKAVTTIMLQTCLRSGDVRNLKWANIDFRTKTITVKQEKTGSMLSIPINRHLRHFLSECDRAGSEYVVPTRTGTKFTRKGLQTAFRKGKRRARVDTTLHILRHTCLTRLYRIAGPIAAQKLAGHSSLAMTQLYLHEDAERLRDAVERLPHYTEITQEPLSFRAAVLKDAPGQDRSSEGQQKKATQDG